MNYHEKALRDLEVAKNYNSAQGNPGNDEGLCMTLRHIMRSRLSKRN